jgi:hypothetical protein
MEDKTFDKGRQFFPELCGVSDMNFRLLAIPLSPTNPQVSEPETIENLRKNSAALE